VPERVRGACTAEKTATRYALGDCFFGMQVPALDVTRTDQSEGRTGVLTRVKLDWIQAKAIMSLETGTTSHLFRQTLAHMEGH